MEKETRVPPDTLLLLRYGTNRYTVDGKEASLELTEQAAENILEEFSDRARDLVIDFEHQTLSGGKAPAAGWIDKLEKTPDGIAAHVRYWTREAADLLERGEYRYFSPTVVFSDHEPCAIHSVALTNHPALHGLTALVANDLHQHNETQTKGFANMTKTEKALQRLLGDTTLALSDDSDNATAAKLEALADELPALRAASAELGKMKTAVVAEKRTLMLADAKKAGRITEATAKTLEGADVGFLGTFLASLSDGCAVPTGKLPAAKEDGEKPKAVQLTDEEKDMARRMGMTDEEFAAEKKRIDELENEPENQTKGLE